MSVPLYEVRAELVGMSGRPVRVRELSQDTPRPVRELLTTAGAGPGTLSQRLTALRRRGIVVSWQEEQEVVCKPTGGDIVDLVRAALHVLAGTPAGPSELPATSQDGSTGVAR